MNIFVLDSDPAKAARDLCDRHIVKMALETAQILSTVSHARGIVAPYKSTHARHPCTLWANETLGNWAWLVLHGFEICAEYRRRFGKVHASQHVIAWLSEYGGHPDSGEQTTFAQAMPDTYRAECAVTAYRAYYYGEKRKFATWRAPSQAPNWWPSAQEGIHG